MNDKALKKAEYDRKRYAEREASGARAAYWAKIRVGFLARQSAIRKAMRLSDPEWVDAERKRSRDYRAKNIERLNAANAIYRERPENRKLARERTRAWADSNKLRVKENAVNWLSRNRHKVAEYSTAYRLRNPEKSRQDKKGWKARNPGKVAADSMFRHATKLMATPKWVDRQAIDKIYKMAAEVTRNTGIKHQVDHIYPLRGRGFVGLHVPWNLQILTAKENMSKGNRLCLP